MTIFIISGDSGEESDASLINLVHSIGLHNVVVVENGDKEKEDLLPWPSSLPDMNDDLHGIQAYLYI